MINCRGARGARLGVRAIVPRSAKQHQRAQAEARASQRAYLLATMPGSIVTMPGAMTGSMDAQVSLPDFDTAMIKYAPSHPPCPFPT